MFVNVTKVSRAATALCALAAISACQDAVAPMPANAPPGDLPTLVASRENKVEREVVKDQYIVVFRDGFDDVDARSSKLMKGNKGRIKHAFRAGIKGFVGAMTAEEAAAMASDPSVRYVEQDQVVTLGVGRPTEGSKPGGKRGGKVAEPADPEPLPGTVVQTPVPSWGLDRLDQESNFFDNKYTYTATGSTVHAYIIDSGIRTTHAEFEGRATADVDFINDGYGATGCNWHGTHVAGTVGGKTAGVAKNVRLHSVRVLDCNAAGEVSGAVAGIDWVIANRVSPAIINLSIQTGGIGVLTDAVERAVAAGITVVVAAGNSGVDACNYSPSNAPNAITVGSLSMEDGLNVFSNYGSCVDIAAPGQYIGSVSNVDDVSFQYGTGTSMAAPHVAGAAALYLERDPVALPATVASAILAKAMVGVMQNLPAGTANLVLRTF